jgi:AcrR family transcriptional regulator
MWYTTIVNRASQKKLQNRYHHGDLRHALVEAALDLIDKGGVTAVTTRALARRLNVSHAAPAHHFKDREALLAEVATQGFRMFADRLEAASRAEREPRSRLVAIGRAYIRFAVEHPAYLRVMFGHGLPDDYVPPEPLRYEADRAYAVLTAGVGALAPRGTSEKAIEELGFGAWSLVHGMAMLWIDRIARSALPTPEALDAAAARLLRQMVPRLGEEPAG